MKIKRFLCIAFLTAITANAQYTKEINTNRPSSSMGAYSVSKGIVQLEGGFSYHHDKFREALKNQQNNFQLQARYGDISDQLEFIADLYFSSYKQQEAHASLSNSGMSQLNFGIKYLLYDHYKYYVEKRNVYSWKANQRFKWRRLIPAVAVYVGAQFNTENNLYYPDLPETSLKTMLIAQQHWNDRFSVTYNLIGSHITDREFNNWSYVITASLGISPRMSVFGEHLGTLSHHYNGFSIPFKDEAAFKGGFTYKLSPDLQIDLFAGTNVDQSPHKLHAGIGLSWRNLKKFVFKDPMEF